MADGSWVGPDVQAISVVAGVIERATGELRMVRAPHRTPELVGWLGSLPEHLRVGYEAGPTGFRPGAPASRAISAGWWPPRA